MKFRLGDRVRVTRAELEEYIGLEGLVVFARPAKDSATFNAYEVRTDDGQQLEFIEYQLERVGS